VTFLDRLLKIFSAFQIRKCVRWDVPPCLLPFWPPTCFLLVPPPGDLLSGPPPGPITESCWLPCPLGRRRFSFYWAVAFESADAWVLFDFLQPARCLFSFGASSLLADVADLSQVNDDSSCFLLRPSHRKPSVFWWGSFLRIFFFRSRGRAFALPPSDAIFCFSVMPAALYSRGLEVVRFFFFPDRRRLLGSVFFSFCRACYRGPRAPSRRSLFRQITIFIPPVSSCPPREESLFSPL